MSGYLFGVLNVIEYNHMTDYKYKLGKSSKINNNYYYIAKATQLAVKHINNKNVTLFVIYQISLLKTSMLSGSFPLSLINC